MAMEMRRTSIESELTQRKVQVEQTEATARIQVAEQKQQLKEKELVASVIRPAEAAREAAIITAEGEGHAAAREAEARAVQATGEAEAAARKAGFLFVLQLLPMIVQSFGDAGQKVVGSAFEPIAQGLSKIDNLNILVMGAGSGTQGTPLERFAMSAPTIVFKVIQQAQALGLDVSAVLKGVGINADELMATLPIRKETALGTTPAGKT